MLLDLSITHSIYHGFIKLLGRESYYDLVKCLVQEDNIPPARGGGRGSKGDTGEGGEYYLSVMGQYYHDLQSIIPNAKNIANYYMAKQS